MRWSDFGVGDAGEIALGIEEISFTGSIEPRGVNRAGEISHEHAVAGDVERDSDPFHQMGEHDFRFGRLVVDRGAIHRIPARWIAAIRPVQNTVLAIDPKFGHIYWTQKGPDNAGLGRLFRANVEIPAGQTVATRSDIEIFYDGLPEPIDLELDHKSRVLYWTDRGDPPRGNTVNRASIDNKPIEPEIVVTHLMEGIGIALDIPNDRMFVTDFAGSIYSARLDGSGERNFLYAPGNLTGIASAEI